MGSKRHRKPLMQWSLKLKQRWFIACIPAPAPPMQVNQSLTTRPSMVVFLHGRLGRISDGAPIFAILQCWLIYGVAPLMEGNPCEWPQLWTCRVKLCMLCGNKRSRVYSLFSVHATDCIETSSLGCTLTPTTMRFLANYDHSEESNKPSAIVDGVYYKKAPRVRSWKCWDSLNTLTHIPCIYDTDSQNPSWYLHGCIQYRLLENVNVYPVVA